MEYVSEIHSLLKLGGDNLILPRINGAPEGLPIVANELPVQPIAHAIQISDQPKKNSWLKNLLIYPVIFIGAFVLFYLIFNFPSLTAQVQGFFTKPQDQTILGDNLAAYYAWIDGYYFSVSDKTLLDPNNDIDKDGLSNMDEFTMRTNPTVADSDSDGYPDGLEVLNSKNPWGFGAFSAAQTQLAESLDMIVVNNRVSFNVSQNQKPNSGSVAAAEIFSYDLNKPGTLSIPRLKIQVPLVWSKDPNDFEKDLSHGVIHYPGTALPGELGTVYVSGHSSDYLWKHDPFSQVFTKLNFLQPGDDIFIDIYGADRKVMTYRYAVVGHSVYKPDDQTQFIDNSSNKLNLSTCWPIGTQTNRLVVSAIQKPL